MGETQISEEAVSWLLELEEDGSPECRAEFKSWLERSPSHMNEFLLVTAAYRELDGVDSQRRIDIAGHLRELQKGRLDNVHILPRDVSWRIASTSNHIAQDHGSRRPLRGWIAASIVLCALAWQWSFPLGAERYETGVGEQRSIKLADGSVVQLNTRSRLEVRYSARTREIRLLDGEALFAVEHDPARPFRVLTDTANILAIGTQFNVYRRAEDTMVAVVQGSVRVTTDLPVTQLKTTAPAGLGAATHIDAASLGAGEQARIGKDGRVVTRADAAAAQATAWRQRKLDFRGATLDEVAREFNRYNREQIRIEGDAVRAKRLNAVFNVDEPQALVEFLSSDPELRIERKEGSLVIHGS